MKNEENHKLYLVHAGYYDDVTSYGGVYEAHTNFFVVSDTPHNARAKAKAIDVFKTRRMHIDGIQEIKVVDGYKIILEKTGNAAPKNEVNPFTFRDLAPPKANSDQ